MFHIPLTSAGIPVVRPRSGTAALRVEHREHRSARLDVKRPPELSIPHGRTALKQRCPGRIHAFRSDKLFAGRIRLAAYSVCSTLALGCQGNTVVTHRRGGCPADGRITHRSGQSARAASSATLPLPSRNRHRLDSSHREAAMRTKLLAVGSLAAGFALFVWQTISQVVLPWHEATMREFANAPQVVAAIKAGAPTSRTGPGTASRRSTSW